MSSVQTAAPEFRSIAIGDLRESKLNPRRHFNADSLAELTASVKAHGVLTPTLVRPVNGHFEIAAGHRRFRAAKAAGLPELPAVVREMDDVAFLEVLVTENLQREDVHPLEEADGYRALMKAGYDVQRIADRVGRSTKYVYDRMKLEELTEESKKLFFEGVITAGHAILLARLSPKDQKRAIASEDENYGDGVEGLFSYENTLWDPRGKRERREQARRTVSVRELQTWIDTHVRLDPGHPDDQELFPALAAALEKEVEKGGQVVQITFEHPPYGRSKPKKNEDPIHFSPDWKAATGKKEEPRCDKAVLGVFVVGPARGQTLDVCVDRKCEVHWKKERASAGGHGYVMSASDRKREEKWKKEDEARRAKRERFRKAGPAIAAALGVAVRKAAVNATGPLMQRALKRIVVDIEPGTEKLAKEIGPKPKDADGFVRYVVLLDLLDELEFDPAAGAKSAQTFGVDVKKILESEAPAEKPAEPQTSAKPIRKKK